MVIVVAVMATTTATHDSTCLFNLEASVSALNQYIEDKVDSMFADEPSMLKCTCDHIMCVLCLLSSHSNSCKDYIYWERW